MRLIKLKIKNFRCYQAETIFIIDDLTAIIGKNDIGKSALLESMDGFFNDAVDQSDLSTNADNNSIELTCTFEGIPQEIVLDTAVPSSPAEEGILNQENQLEVKKVFSFGAGGRKTSAVFLVANYPSDPRLEKLLTMKNTLLKSYANELGVNLEGVNKAKNPPLRERIRNHIGGGRALRELKVDGTLDSEDNLKAIWSSLKKLLPIFSLFKCDKAFDDKDGDIKDPLSAAIDEALALEEIQGLLEIIEQKVKEFTTDIADRTIEKLKSFDKDISERLKSAFSKNPNYSKIFDLTLLNEKNIPLNKRGSGIRRLVILSFFQAQAERRKIKEDAPSIIYAIEEPETSQHPNHQRMIIDALYELSKQLDVQVLFSTHSANLVREIPIQSLRFLSLEEDQVKIEYGKTLEGETDESVIEKIIKTLGILPNPADKIKVLVYVEGVHDINALKQYSHVMNASDQNILNLSASKKIGYVITGGSSLKHYIEQKYLEGLGKPEVHIYDSDVPGYIDLVQQLNNENNPNKVGFNTIKLELENYLHHSAIIEAYAMNGTNLLLNPVEDQLDVPLEVAKKLNEMGNNNWNQLEPEKKKELASEKKKLLNTVAVEKMTVERMRERGGYEEIRSWLDKIKSYIE